MPAVSTNWARGPGAHVVIVATQGLLTVNDRIGDGDVLGPLRLRGNSLTIQHFTPAWRPAPLRMRMGRRPDDGRVPRLV